MRVDIREVDRHTQLKHKGGQREEDNRSRLVAKQFYDWADTIAEMFAATPPSEMFKVLISRCVSGRGRSKQIMTVDVKSLLLRRGTWGDLHRTAPGAQDGG